MRKKLRDFAKAMFKKSLSDGFLDEKKVKQVLKEIADQKGTQTVKILRIYKKLIEKALANEEIIIESAQKNMTNKKEIEKTLLSKTNAKKVVFRTNPTIVFGARITHGDWIYDSTLDAKLKQLTINN